MAHFGSDLREENESDSESEPEPEPEPFFGINFFKRNPSPIPGESFDGKEYARRHNEAWHASQAQRAQEAKRKIGALSDFLSAGLKDENSEQTQPSLPQLPDLSREYTAQEKADVRRKVNEDHRLHYLANQPAAEEDGEDSEEDDEEDDFPWHEFEDILEEAREERQKEKALYARRKKAWEQKEATEKGADCWRKAPLREIMGLINGPFDDGINVPTELEKQKFVQEIEAKTAQERYGAMAAVLASDERIKAAEKAAAKENKARQIAVFRAQYGATTTTDDVSSPSKRRSGRAPEEQDTGISEVRTEKPVPSKKRSGSDESAQPAPRKRMSSTADSKTVRIPKRKRGALAEEDDDDDDDDYAPLRDDGAPRLEGSGRFQTGLGIEQLSSSEVMRSAAATKSTSKRAAGSKRKQQDKDVTAPARKSKARRVSPADVEEVAEKTNSLSDRENLGPKAKGKALVRVEKTEETMMVIIKTTTEKVTTFSQDEAGSPGDQENVISSVKKPAPSKRTTKKPSAAKGKGKAMGQDEEEESIFLEPDTQKRRARKAFKSEAKVVVEDDDDEE